MASKRGVISNTSSNVTALEDIIKRRTDVVIDSTELPSDFKGVKDNYQMKSFDPHLFKKPTPEYEESEEDIESEVSELLQTPPPKKQAAKIEQPKKVIPQIVQKTSREHEMGSFYDSEIDSVDQLPPPKANLNTNRAKLSVEQSPYESLVSKTSIERSRDQ